MNKIFTAIFCATAPLASADITDAKTEETQSKYTLGKQTVSSIRQAYQKGEYSEFLTEMDTAYTQAQSNNELDGHIQMRQKQIPAAFQDKWEQQFSDLQKLKNKDLLSALSDKDDSPFAQKVRSLAGNLSTPEQEKAISKIHSLIAMAPKTGVGPDENTLIDIDLEYEYKLHNALLPSSDTSPSHLQQHQLALRMEKMDRMMQAAKTFQDHTLKQAVGLAAANLDARLARNLDGADLNALVKSQKPANATEERIFSILLSYQGQFSDLMKQLADENR